MLMRPQALRPGSRPDVDFDHTDPMPRGGELLVDPEAQVLRFLEPAVMQADDR